MKSKAIQKLTEELEKAADKDFAKLVIEHLIDKCRESEALAEDVLQEKKTWKGCFNYLYKKARETAVKGASGAVIKDEVVYEWAEDYFHEIEVEETKPVKQTATKLPSPVPFTPKVIPARIESPKKKGEIEGQLDMFALFGM